MNDNEITELREKYAMYNKFYQRKNLSYSQYRNLRDKMMEIEDQLDELVRCDDCQHLMRECTCAF